jgi:hypothetical protein
MTSYLEAKVVPVVNPFAGVSKVFVAEISSEGLSGEAHLPQYIVSSGFSK